MSMKNKSKIIIAEGHRAPTTRRDFLRYGIIPFAGHVLMPGLLSQMLMSLVSKNTLAGPQTESQGYIPFLVFDMAGGAALPGNFLVGKSGGPEDLIDSYETLGWNPRASGALDKSFGVPMSKNDSQILAGIRQGATPQALANLRMGTFCHFSQDDTSSNLLSALTLVSRAGLQGRYFRNGVGARYFVDGVLSGNSLSGGHSDGSLKDSQYKPLFVQTALDIQGSVSHGPAFDRFSDDEIRSVSRAISDLSAEQMKKLGKMKGGEALTQIAGRSYQATLPYGKTVEALDARRDQNVAEVYQLNQNAGLSGDNQVFGSIAYNVLQGHTGPGAITIGGCDYHAPMKPEVGQQKDFEMGLQIGRAVELAYRLKKPLFFQLVTDGGVASLPGTRIWNSDSNVSGLTVVGYYNPNSVPQQRRFQVGEYNNVGTVNQDNALVGGDVDTAPSRVADAVLVNYLSVCGKTGEYEKAGRQMFRTAELDSVLIF